MAISLKIEIKEDSGNVHSSPVIEIIYATVAEGRSCLIGRSRKCDVILKDEFCSSKHCEFKFQDGYLVVKDFESKNGTYVNGNKVTESYINLGDYVNIGYCFIRIDETKTSEKDLIILKSRIK